MMLKAKKIAESLQPSLGYLFRLHQRMEKRGFLPSDPYYQLVCRAYDAMHVLCVQTHYLSCNGVGRPRRGDDDEGSLEDR